MYTLITAHPFWVFFANHWLNLLGWAVVLAITNKMFEIARPFLGEQINAICNWRFNPDWDGRGVDNPVLRLEITNDEYHDITNARLSFRQMMVNEPRERRDGSGIRDNFWREVLKEALPKTRNIPLAGGVLPAGEPIVLDVACQTGQSNLIGYMVEGDLASNIPDRLVRMEMVLSGEIGGRKIEDVPIRGEIELRERKIIGNPPSTETWSFGEDGIKTVHSRTTPGEPQVTTHYEFRFTPLENLND
jgi:hypothetical protein